MKFSRGTKIIHLIIVITVTLQILSQYWMFVPTPDKQPPVQWAAWLYVIHLCIGMVVLCFVAVRLMMIMEEEEYSKRLYPWFDKASFIKLWSQLRAVSVTAGKESQVEEDNRIAAVVHGLGLLVLLALGVTGVLFFLGLAPNGYMDAMTAFLRSTHEVLAILLFLFLAGHIGMTIRHRINGNQAAQDMFTIEEKQSSES